MTPEQLPLPVTPPRRRAYRREEFLVSASNAAALALVDGWRGWPGGQAALTGPEGAAASAGTTLSLAEPPAGQYDMVLEVLAPGGCLASSSASLHVVQGPTAGFSLPNEACAGDTVDVGLASGTVTAVFVDDGQPVEFGEPLLVIE